MPNKIKLDCPYKHKWGSAEEHEECITCILWENCINKNQDVGNFYKLNDEELNLILIALDNACYNYPIEPEKFKRLKEKLNVLFMKK